MVLTPEKILLLIFAVTFAVGAVDHLCGGKTGLGKKFLEGLNTFAPLFLTMAGFLVLAPLIAKLLSSGATAVFTALGADPGLFPGMLLACDNGAYPLAQSMGIAPEAGGFGGMLLGSLMGANVICMPLALLLLEKSDRPYFFRGLMYSVIVMPVAMLIGGICAGYSMKFIMQQMPLLLGLSVTSALLLKFVPDLLIKCLTVLSKIMETISMAGVTVAFFAELAGVKIACINPIGEAIVIIGNIALLLGGVYVFTAILTRLLSKVMPRICSLLQVNEVAVVGLLTTLANSIPALSMIKDMDARGKQLNCAFMASAAFMLGDHLAYCGAVAQEMLFPLISAKLTGGVLAAGLAMYLWRNK